MWLNIFLNECLFRRLAPRRWVIKEHCIIVLSSLMNCKDNVWGHWQLSAKKSGIYNNDKYECFNLHPKPLTCIENYKYKIKIFSFLTFVPK